MKMTLPSLVILCCFALVAVVNADVVVFVHGLAGFGPSELFSLGYWGFSGVFGSGQDYLKSVRDKGHQVFYASVGPVSSNWDRACELYAQIKGTRTDYGAAHSSKYGHARNGPDYTGKGFYPSWDGSRRIHLVGHSLGGNTIRMLEYLLQNGAPEEVTASGTGVNDLFKASKTGGSTWIQSITTISTPHDGSTLHTKLGGSLVNFIKDLLGVFAGVAGLAPTAEWSYNLDLDHFGLQRQSGEGFKAYLNRVMSSAIFKPSFKDLASWDLSPEAAREFNRKTKLTYPDTYYFSVSTQQTHGCLFNDHCPDLDIEALMATTAAILGDIDGTCDSTGYCFGNEWEPNDGMVPVRSSKSPQNGISGYVAPLNWASTSSYAKGKWYNRMVYRDHMQIIGFRLNILELNAADGIYGIIGDTISRVRVSASAEEIEASITEATVGAIAGGALAGLSALVLLGVGVVTIRRRRHEKRMITAFSSKPASQFSPRSFTKKQIERGSITLHNAVESDNPAFEINSDVESQEEEAEKSDIQVQGVPDRVTI